MDFATGGIVDLEGWCHGVNSRWKPRQVDRVSRVWLQEEVGSWL